MTQDMGEIGSTGSVFRGIDCGPAYSVTPWGIECMAPVNHGPTARQTGELAIQAAFAGIVATEQPEQVEVVDHTPTDVLETVGA